MKTKILLVTIFDNINFGTYLQALATGVVLQRMGADVRILWYERPWHRLRTSFDKYFPFVRKIGWFYAQMTDNKGYIQKYKCRQFVQKYIPITKLYYSYDEIKNNPPKANVYLTGSDQVWNTSHNKGIEPVYYLDFVKKGKKVAYAASIGQKKIDPKYVDETRKLLSQYEAISVREKSAIELLNDIGINADAVLDPTLLLTREEWCFYTRPFRSNRPYVLVYSVESGDQDVTISRTARVIANQINGEVIEVNYVGSHKQIPNCDKRYYYATPDLFLSLLLGASFTVVSSFHGTAFSLNLNIPFITVAPQAFSSRVENILSETRTMDRKISEFNESAVLKMFNTPIDFRAINSYFEDKRRKSIEFISSNILK